MRRYRAARNRAPSARLTMKQVYAAYRLYDKGFSVPQVANLIWEKLGFASTRSCQSSLYDSFAAYQLPTRTPNEGRYLDHNCKGCGCDRDDRTRGCDTCKSRHGSRHLRPNERPAIMVRV